MSKEISSHNSSYLRKQSILGTDLTYRLFYYSAELLWTNSFFSSGSYMLTSVTKSFAFLEMKRITEQLDILIFEVRAANLNNKR